MATKPQLELDVAGYTTRLRAEAQRMRRVGDAGEVGVTRTSSSRATPGLTQQAAALVSEASTLASTALVRGLATLGRQAPSWLQPRPSVLTARLQETTEALENRAARQLADLDSQHSYVLRVQGAALALEEAAVLMELHALGRSTIPGANTPCDEVERYRLAVRERARSLEGRGSTVSARLNDGRASGLVRATSYLPEHLQPVSPHAQPQAPAAP